MTPQSNRYYNLSLANGQKVIITAYPTSSAVITPASILQFTYNITSPYYPPQGMIAQIKAEIAEDVDASMFWYVCAIAFGLILVAMIVACFTVCCCRDYDPLSKFERRRKRQSKENKVKDKKLAKKPAAKKGGALSGLEDDFNDIEQP